MIDIILYRWKSFSQPMGTLLASSFLFCSNGPLWICKSVKGFWWYCTRICIARVFVSTELVLLWWRIYVMHCVATRTPSCQCHYFSFRLYYLFSHGPVLSSFTSFPKCRIVRWCYEKRPNRSTVESVCHDGTLVRGWVSVRLGYGFSSIRTEKNYWSDRTYGVQ